MAEQAYAYVTLIPVAKGFQSAIAKELAGVPSLGSKTGMNLGGKFVSGFGSALKGVPVLVGGVVAAAAGLAFAFKPAIDASSALYAETEGVKQIFGSAAQSVLNFGQTAATNFGLSQTAALQAAKNFGGFATVAGLSGQAAAKFSTDLVAAAGDLASFADVPVEEALSAIESGLSGSSEPLRKFQIFIDDTTLKAYAMDKGLGDVYDTMSQGDKAMLRQEAILDQLGVKQGDFVNYQDTYGNALKTITSTFENMTAQIGDALMPSVEQMTIGFRDALGEIGDATSPVGEAWNELIGTFEAFGETVASVFGEIDLAGVLETIFDAVQLLVNGMSQLIYVGGDVADILGKVFSGDFEGAGKQAGSFFDRYNAFVQGLYDKADASANRAKANQNQIPIGGGIYIDRNSANTVAEIGKQFSGGSAGGAGPTQAEIREQVKGYIADAKDAVKEARKEYKKAVADARADYADTVSDIGADYSDAVAEANDRYAKQVASITKRYNDAVAEATKRRDSSLADSLKNYNSAVAEINADFAQRQSDIIAQSMARLTDAFRSAVQTNVATIFDSDEIAGSIDGTIEMMREKLMASRQLIANAAALSAAGFSQTFIEQIVGAGTDVGNEMATAILNSSPEQQAEMMALFGEIETTAAHGMDSLAESLYEKNGLATEELKNLYANTELELQNSLIRQKALYDEEVTRIETEFKESVASSKAIMDEALVEAQTALDEALLEAKIRRDEALADAEETLQKALVKAATNFDDDLKRIEKTFNEKIAAMKGKVAGLTSEIATLQGQIDKAQADAARTVQINTPKVKLAEGGLVTGPTNALVGEAGPELVIPLDRFESMVGMAQGGASVNYYAAPNQSLDAEQELFQAMQRAKVVVGW